MRFIRQLLPAFFVFISLSVLAQKKTYTGYYISVSGDTVRGIFPSYSQWSRNPSEVKFLVSGETSAIQLLPNTARSFVIEGYDEYIAYNGPRLINPIEDGLLFNHSVFTSHADSVQPTTTFLQLLVRTSIGNLYLYNDGNRTNFFYQSSDQLPVELRYKKALIQDRIVATADYRQQLQQLFAIEIATNNLGLALENLSYNAKSLMAFFSSLFPSATVPKARENASSIQWVVAAGASFNQFTVSATKFAVNVPEEYNISPSPLFSIGAMIPLRRNFGMYFLYPQLRLSRYAAVGEKMITASNNIFSFEAPVVIMPGVSGGMNLIKSERHRVFVTAGVGVLYQPGAKQIRQRYDAPAYTISSTEETKLPATTFTFNASVGTDAGKKFFLLATYLAPTSIANYSFYSSKFSGIQLQVGYKL